MSLLVQPHAALGEARPGDYEQIINYTMLYDSGDECSEEHGGWVESYTNNTTVVEGVDTSCVATKNKDSLYLKNTDTGNTTQCFITKDKFDISDFNKLIIKYTSTSSIASTSGRMRLTKVPYTENYWNSANRLTDTDLPLGSNLICEVDVDGVNEQASLYVAAIPKCSAELTVYDIFLTKPDDYNTLCYKAGVSIPSSLKSLLADTTSIATIFNNEDAVKFMVTQCTGDFMVGVLNSADAVALLKASPYLNLVIANPHWAKFMMVIPNAKELLNFTMLYDEGDECTDVTGGWNALNNQWINSGAVAARFITKNKIDLSQFSAIAVRANATVGTGTTAEIRVQNTTTFEDYAQKLIGYSDVTPFDGIGVYKLTSPWNAHYIELFAITAGAYADRMSVDLAKNEDHLYVYAIYTGYGSTTCKVYNMVGVKPDDYNELCDKAGISTFATVDELVADSSAMATIMSNEEAVKYLIGCTGDLMVSICNSEVAMAALVNNIAYDYAFNHPVWYKFMTMIPTALAAMDSVAVTVPTMTSNTTPSGVASADIVNVAAADAYKAFDGDNVSSWVSTYGSTPPHWVQYNFGKFIDLYKIAMFWDPDGSYTTVSSGYVSVSSNGVDYDIVYNFDSLAVNKLHEIVLDSVQRCKIVRITITAFNNNYDKKSCRVFEAQYYGKAVNE